jgi:hypothetical protein
MKRLILTYRILFYVIILSFISGSTFAQTINTRKVTKETMPPYLNQIPEIPYAGEIPLVPNVRPVIILQGTDYEMGYQHAQQIIQIFGRYYLEKAATFKRDEKAVAAIKTSEGYIKKYTPWAIDYVKGMADGCVSAGIPMTYFQMLAYFSGIGGSEDCSGWAAWGSATKDGKLICGGSGDHEIRVGSVNEYRFEINLMLFPQTGNNYIFSPPSGGAGHPGMNNKGVVNVHHGTTGYYDRYRNPDRGSTGEGVPRVFLLMHCLRFANTAEEAKDIALSIPDPAQRQGGIWADVKGNALVIENKDNPTVIRRPGDHGEKDFLYSTNNLFSEELKGAYIPPQGQNLIFYPHVGYLGTDGSLSSIGRNFELWNLFHNYHGEVDLDFAKMMWRFKGPKLPYATIDEAIEDRTRSQAKHWDAHISQPGNSVVAILQPDEGNNGLIHVSHGCAVKDNDSPTYAGGVVVRLNPTFTFFELKLGSSPSDVCNAAQTRARYDLWNAYQELSKLDYTDVRYSELDKKLNEAVVEWQKGWFYRDEADASKGNEVVVKKAQAIRCYTRCQSYARQVYETIIPPPKCPEDLNLRQWFGNWGEWATRNSGVIVK